MGFTDHLSRDEKRLLQGQQVDRSQARKDDAETQAPKSARADSLLLTLLFLLTVGGLFLIFHNTENIASAATPDFIGRNAVKSAARVAEMNRIIPEASFRLPANGMEPDRFPSRAYPLPKLEKVDLSYTSHGRVHLDSMPPFETTFSDRVTGISEDGDLVYFSVNPDLQKYVESVLKGSVASEVAVVAMEPDTGRILAIGGKSRTVNNLALHAGFPAASLFKLVTSAAALERGVVEPFSQIKFRGGTYTLNQWNYRADSRKDRRVMPLAEALGRSCNPVFARVALQYLNSSTIKRYAQMFGFNSDLQFDMAIENSSAFIPSDDYELSRTAAGFGEVTVSPVHAAAFMAGIANGGTLPRPSLIDTVVSQEGELRYQARPEGLQRIIRPGTARKLLKMMEFTTTVGTSRKEFMSNNKPILPISVAAKTGTLRGTAPAGITNWFVAAAPLQKPEIALAVVVVNPNVSSKASRIGRLVLQNFLSSKR